MEYPDGLDALLAERDAVLGARATVPSPATVEVYGDIGLDFAWLDLEHTGPSDDDAPALEGLSRAATVAGIEPLVRVRSADPSVVRTVLDAGIRTVLVPRVETVDELREAVRASRFVSGDGPGTRGATAGRVANWGARPEDFVAREDGAACVGAMIETAAAVERIDELLDVPDLGFVFVGPADLSVSLGHPLESDHPEVREAVERVREAALDAGVPVGCIRTDPERAAEAIERGYSIVRVGDEMAAARTVLGERVDRIDGVRGDRD